MRFFKLLLLVLVFGSATAYAHTSLVSSIPESGEVLTELPEEVRIKFNENLLLVDDKNPNRLEVIDPSGQVISTTARVAGPDLFANVDRLELAGGEYTVRYRVISADGHPVEGEYEFSVATPEVISAPVDSNETSNSDQGIVRLIWVLLALSGIGLLALLRLR